MRRALLVTTAFTLLLGGARSATAGQNAGTEPPALDRGQLTFGGGLALYGGSLREGAGRGSFSAPPPVYFGAELQLRVWHRLGIGLMAGGNLDLGWLLGANVRAETHPADGLFISAGAGPVVLPGGSLAGAIFAQGDLTLSWRFTTYAALMFGPMLQVAVRQGGSAYCGFDTCQPWVGTGTRVFIVRAGVGPAF